jgi:hypothetical protein
VTGKQLQGNPAIGLHAQQEDILVEVELRVVKRRAAGLPDTQEKETALCLLKGFIRQGVNYSKTTIPFSACSAVSAVNGFAGANKGQRL